MLNQASAMHAVIRLHPDDDVVIATRQLVSGTRIDAEDLVVSGLIPPGHKIATRAIAKGEPVKRYNQIIGVAREAIARGQHVHVHNLGMAEFAREHAFCVDARPTRTPRSPRSSRAYAAKTAASPRATTSAC